nr:12558_t:CDS:2 [Entrophospora candida]
MISGYLKQAERYYFNNNNSNNNMLENIWNSLESHLDIDQNLIDNFKGFLDSV